MVFSIKPPCADIAAAYNGDTLLSQFRPQYLQKADVIHKKHQKARFIPNRASVFRKSILLYADLQKSFYDLIAKRKNVIQYPVGAKRSSHCSSRLFAEDSCSEHKE